MITQVAIDVLEAVVPEEDEVAPPDLPESLDAEMDYILKVPK